LQHDHLKAPHTNAKDFIAMALMPTIHLVKEKNSALMPLVEKLD